MFEIIYEDQQMIVAYKKAGVATQTKRLGQQDMVSLLKNYRAKKKEKPYIGLIHRLDQPVEGLLVFAKDEKTAAELSRQVQSRTMKKFYYALVEGEPKERCGELKNDIAFDARANCSYLVDDSYELLAGSHQVPDFVLSHKQAKQKGLKEQSARLYYEVKEIYEGKSLVDIHLLTGRHHQIRLQMAGIGCPLVGDQKYGHGKKGENVALCSYGLDFIHPKTGKEVSFRIEPKNPLFP